jgi:hypothetical protein
MGEGGLLEGQALARTLRSEAGREAMKACRTGATYEIKGR